MTDIPLWVGVLASIFGIIGFPLAVFFWWKPRHPRFRSRGKASKEILIEVSTAFPVFRVGQPSEELGDHLVQITVRNLSDRKHQVINWAIEAPKMNNIFIVRPIHWDPKLPCWIDPGQSISFHIPAQEIRSISQERRIPFKKMRPWVKFGDGSKVYSKRSVPLA